MKNNDENKSLYVRIGKNITFFRKERKLNQETLGFYLGLSQSMISQYETAKKTPNLETIIKISNYFNIDLEDFMFTDFGIDESFFIERNISKVTLWPIVKCAQRTYFCYYIKEQNKGTYDLVHKIAYFTIKVLEPKSENSAKVILQFPEKEHTYDALLTLDDRYAYIECHEYFRNYFFHLTFYYHKSRPNPFYSGGIGLMQRLDANGLPVCQYCVLSCKQIREQKQRELSLFFRIQEDHNLQLPRRKFSSSSVVRLTKTVDQAVFDWLRKNNYT